MAKRKPLDPYTLEWVIKNLRQQLCACAQSRCAAKRELVDDRARVWRKRLAAEARALKPAKRTKR